MVKACSFNNKLKSMELKFSAPKAKKVSVAGTFNNWDTKTTTAKKDTRGNWSVKLDLAPGRYEYKFVVDGVWLNDPKCNNVVGNSFGTQNSILEIK